MDTKLTADSFLQMLPFEISEDVEVLYINQLMHFQECTVVDGEDVFYLWQRTKALSRIVEDFTGCLEVEKTEEV